MMRPAQALPVSTLSPPQPEAPSAGPSASPSEAEKRAALAQVLATAAFERAEQLRSFLRYIGEMEIVGRGGDLSEYRIGVEALGKPDGYSTGDDSSVRKRAHDLRQRLEELYAGELAAAPVRIDLPKGRYAPRFLYASAPGALVAAPLAARTAAALDIPAPVEPALRPPRTRILVKTFWFGLVVGVLAVLAAQRVWMKLHPAREIAPDPGLVVEAENRANELTGEAVATSCPACSGRGRVKWIGRGGTVTLPVDVHDAGEYMLQIDYLLEGPRSFFISVNDEPGREVPVRGNHWWIPASTGLMVHLKAGRNTVRFYNPDHYAPDLDRIVVR
jgi:hypothetical protein